MRPNTMRSWSKGTQIIMDLEWRFCNQGFLQRDKGNKLGELKYGGLKDSSILVGDEIIELEEMTGATCPMDTR